MGVGTCRLVASREIQMFPAILTVAFGDGVGQVVGGSGRVSFVGL